MYGLYSMSIREAEALDEAYCEKLFPLRLAKAKRFLRNEDRLRCIAAGALTACVLGIKETDIRLNEWGKPEIIGNRAYFSLSHSGPYAILAADTTPVGADIEQPGPPNAAVARRIFTPDELEWMNESPETRFFTLWTLKESFMKLDGRGFALSPASFNALKLLSEEGILTQSGLRVYASAGEYGGCALAVCSVHKTDDIKVCPVTAEDALRRAADI